jgi:uncharacterized Fe-S center protein
MKSSVYFIDLRASGKENFLQKIQRLITTTGLPDVVSEKDLVAIKLHFGELGNTAFLRPIFLRSIVQSLKELKTVPFLTDSNTLYAGTRNDAPSHLTTAIHNGFDYAVVEAPLVIADGLRGKTDTSVKVSLKHCKEVHIGSEIVNADALISVAHFKAHEMTGFGGALKNIGMGCASRRGKMDQHSSVRPSVNQETCIACGECMNHCIHHAISYPDKKASIDSNICTGCGECILVCPTESVQIHWNQSVPVLQEKMMEYCHGVLKNKKGKSMFVNFINAVSPQCDCYGYSDAPIVRDIGVVASRDPVAIDQASADLVNQEPALADCCLIQNTKAGEDKFKGVFPHIDWETQLEYAEKIGLGSRAYDLKKI